MDYLKGSRESCKAYNEMVYNACPSMLNNPHTTAYASIIERDGNFYIRKHPDYPATSGLVEADLPPAPEDTDGI